MKWISDYLYYLIWLSILALLGDLSVKAYKITHRKGE